MAVTASCDAAKKLVGWSEAPALTPQVLASLPSPPPAYIFFCFGDLACFSCISCGPSAPGWAGPCGFRAPGPQQAAAGEAGRKVRAGLTKAGRPARRHQNCYETALNARQTSQTERRRAGNSRPCLRLDSQLEPKPPLDVHFPCVKKFRCQLATWPTNPTKPAIAHPPRTTGIRDIPLR